MRLSRSTRNGIEPTKAGIYKATMKAGELVAWLKQEYDLGHGHSMAVWAVFKEQGWVEQPKAKK
jgi:transposase